MALQDDYLSTVIRDLTVELASKWYDGFVTIRREALGVRYRVGGGEGDAGPGYKDFGIDWGRIVKWFLFHQVSCVMESVVCVFLEQVFGAGVRIWSLELE